MSSKPTFFEEAEINSNCFKVTKRRFRVAQFPSGCLASRVRHSLGQNFAKEKTSTTLIDSASLHSNAAFKLPPFFRYNLQMFRSLESNSTDHWKALAPSQSPLRSTGALVYCKPSELWEVRGAQRMPIGLGGELRFSASLCLALGRDLCAHLRQSSAAAAARRRQCDAKDSRKITHLLWEPCSQQKGNRERGGECERVRLEYLLKRLAKVCGTSVWDAFGAPLKARRPFACHSIRPRRRRRRQWWPLLRLHLIGARPSGVSAATGLRCADRQAFFEPPLRGPMGAADELAGRPELSCGGGGADCCCCCLWRCLCLCCCCCCCSCFRRRRWPSVELAGGR